MKRIFYDQIALDSVAKYDAMIAAMDPFPLDLEKYSHHFEEGQRVKFKETGHRGKIKSINAHGGGHNVMLDSGHFVECRDSEIEPEDFPASNSSGAHLDRVQKGGSSLDGLLAAMENGTISDHDRVIVTEELRKWEACEGAVDPLAGISTVYAEWHDPRLHVLTIMAVKYAGTTATSPDALAKRAKSSDLRVGMKVKDKASGSIGTLTRIGAMGDVEIEFEKGHTMVCMEKYIEVA